MEGFGRRLGLAHRAIPKAIQDKKIKSVTLTFVQSVPKFAKDGAIRFFLAPDLDATKDLKFDANATDGVGDQIKPLNALGSGNFKKIETGKTESFSLTVDDTAREQISDPRLHSRPTDRWIRAWFLLPVGTVRLARRVFTRRRHPPRRTRSQSRRCSFQRRN